MKKDWKPGTPFHTLWCLAEWWPEMMETLKRIERRLAAVEKKQVRRTPRRKAGAR